MGIAPGSENLELNVVLRSVSHRARVLTGATGVAIALAHKGSMICRATVGSNAPSLGCRLDTSSGLSGECVRSSKALRCDDSEDDPRVDVASCRRLGIRSVVAVPILRAGEVVGILETFSPAPKAFSEVDVTALNTLAESVFARSSVDTPIWTVERAPADPDAAGNLDELVPSSTQATAACIPAPDQLWSNVFLTARPPWRRLGESALLHILMIAALGTLKLSVSHPRFVPPAFTSSDVLYVPVEPVRTGKRHWMAADRGRSEAIRVLAVAREQRSRTEAAIAPPNIRIKQQIRVLHVLAWRVLTPAVPAPTISGFRAITPAALVGAIPPPPETSALAKTRALTSPAGIVGPPPSLRNSVGRTGKVSLAHWEVVSPPPQVPSGKTNSTLAVARAGLGGGVLAAVIAPPPALAQLDGTGAHTSASVAAASDIVPPPPSVAGTANFGSLGNGSIPGMQVVPPSPSLGPEGNIGAAAAHLPISGSESASGPSSPAADSDFPPTLPPQPKIHVSDPVIAEVSTSQEKSPKAREVTVAFIGPVLPLPSSSYFSSSEIFIAEERVRSHETRLIKLVYDYLPYQHRLSEDGPNYPDVDKLRVTRDLSCDETLKQLTLGLGTSDGAVTGKLSRDEDLRGQQAKIPCFRTTADDYQKAHVRARR